MKNNFRSLHNLDLFQNINPEQLKELKTNFMEYTFRPKEMIFSPGKFPNSILLVLEGSIRVFLSYPQGKEFTLTILEPGDVYSGHTRAFGEALQEVKLVAVPMELFKDLMQKIPGLVFSLVGVLGDSLRGSMDIIEGLVFQEADTRLTSLLLKWSKDGVKTDKGILIELTLTREQIASMIGCSRQTLATLFKNLTKAGYIVIDNKNLIIRDLERLKKHNNDTISG